MKLPERVLVDASVAIKWVVDEPGSAVAALLLERRLMAPDLLSSECANILWKKVMLRELTAEEADLAARALEGAEVELVATRPYLAAAAAIAIELDHPAYDGIYLAVAEAMALPLVTADARLVAKARAGRGRFSERLVALSEVPAAL